MSLNINLISFNLKNIKIISLITFKKLIKKSRMKIIIITFKNIEKQKKNNKKIEKNL